MTVTLNRLGNGELKYANSMAMIKLQVSVQKG